VVDARAAVVFTLSNERIVEMRLYQARGEALKAVGLEE
jgi:hypothetical protein